jgi:hypothetical protein
VAIAGSTVVVGAPGATTPSGSTVVVGDNNRNAAYVFANDGSGWTQLRERVAIIRI